MVTAADARGGWDDQRQDHEGDRRHAETIKHGIQRERVFMTVRLTVVVPPPTMLQKAAVPLVRRQNRAPRVGKNRPATMNE